MGEPAESTEGTPENRKEEKPKLEKIEDNFGVCNTCPGHANKGLNECNVLRELKQLIGMHSNMMGEEPMMEIQVHKCHHRTRMIKEQQANVELCPNCGGNMIDIGTGSRCENCGLQDVN